MREFLGLLGDPTLTEVAYEAVDEVEGLIATGADPGETLAGVVTYLADTQRRAEQQKLLAEIRRTSGERGAAGQVEGPAGQTDELSLFAELVKKNQATNLRRIGPVKRLGS